MLNRKSQSWQTPASGACGFTLIETMITVAIIGILVMSSLPALQSWLQNLQTRNAAEAVMLGLQIARNEAVRRNSPVRLTLTGTAASPTTGWTVGCVTVTAECPATIQERGASEGSSNARVGVATAAGTYTTALAPGAGMPGYVTFTGLGRMQTSGTDLARIDVLNPSFADAKRLTVTISTGGLIRMCDPSVTTAGDSRRCQ